MKLFIHRSLSTSGITSYHKLCLQYFTDSGERESRPFREQPETHLYFNQHLVLHLDILHGFLRTQHCRHVHNHKSLQLVEIRPYAEEEEATDRIDTSGSVKTGYSIRAMVTSYFYITCYDIPHVNDTV